MLESAFNIVYDRPNRGFLHGKALATLMMIGSLSLLFASLVVGSIGLEVLKRYTGFSGNAVFARVTAIAISRVGIFVFLASAYYVLTNVDLTLAGGAARRDHRSGDPRGDVPGAAAVRARLEAQPGAADALGPGGAARLALRDGERDRARRRGQLVAAPGERASTAA